MENIVIIVVMEYKPCLRAAFQQDLILLGLLFSIDLQGQCTVEQSCWHVSL